MSYPWPRSDCSNEDSVDCTEKDHFVSHSHPSLLSLSASQQKMLQRAYPGQCAGNRGSGFSFGMRKSKRNINAQDNILPDGSMSSDLKEFLSNALADMKQNAVDHRQPPWMAFPAYDRYSMGWRMGSGEDYWHAFQAWIRSLERSDMDAFISAHPEPESWRGFYDAIGFDSQ